MKIKVGALFAGYGGIELALAQVAAEYPDVEIELAWYCEVDPAASKILAHHYPGVPNLGDVTKVRWATDVDRVHVIAGGSPCQDLSHAGKRAGMKAGTRSGLWASMCDAIEIIRPKLVIWENVRGALSAEADSAVEPCPLCVGDNPGTTLRALGRVLGDLSELGYDARWYGLRAADVGAAHGRFRVFLFATPADCDLSGLQERRDAGCVQASSLGAPSAADGDHRQSPPVPGQLTLLPPPAVNDMGKAYTPEEWDAWTARMKAEHGNGNGHGKSLNIEALRLLKTPTSQLAVNGGSQHPDKRKGGGHGPTLADEVEHLLPTPRATRGGSGTETLCGLGAERSDMHRPQGEVLLPTPRATDGTKGGPNQRGSSGDLMLPSAVQDWREYEAAIRRQEAAFGRPAPLPTEPGAKGQPRLSPRFVEWLMGLPEGHVTNPDIGISRNDQLKALGNGVVPQQCAAALRAFLHDTTQERAA